MKRFIGNVFSSTDDMLIVNKKRTWIHVHYKNADAPIFEEGQTVSVESEYHFPITTSTWTNEHGHLITDRVRGKYYLWSEWVKVEAV